MPGRWLFGQRAPFAARLLDPIQSPDCSGAFRHNQMVRSHPRCYSLRYSSADSSVENRTIYPRWCDFFPCNTKFIAPFDNPFLRQNCLRLSITNSLPSGVVTMYWFTLRSIDIFIRASSEGFLCGLAARSFWRVSSDNLFPVLIAESSLLVSSERTTPKFVAAIGARL
jgi:hypothetical protein